MVWDALKNEYNAGDPGGSSAKGLVLSALPAKLAHWLASASRQSEQGQQLRGLGFGMPCMGL